MMEGQRKNSYNINSLQNNFSGLSLLDHDTNINRLLEVNIYPTRSEIFAKSRPPIAPNKIDGPYSSVTQYLKVQYDLLREDFVGPLRQDLTNYEEGHSEDSLQNLHFHEVRFLRKGVKHDSTCHCIEILSKLDNVEVLSASKRLITGSFVLFYYDNLQTVICGRVEDNGQLKSKRLLVSLHPESYIFSNRQYTMIEYTVFFEAYYCALKALQGMSDSTFPMERYIVKLNLSVNRPSYLYGITRVVNELNLNKSQRSAWENAVNKEFVLIQGPPGTGKTFLGLKIVKDLIMNCNRVSPILVITFKNHVLDQFLEGLLDTTHDIIRLGGQSKNPKMANLSIRSQRIEHQKQYTFSNSFAVKQCYKRYIEAENRIKKFGEQLDMMITGEAIMNFAFSTDIEGAGLPYCWKKLGSKETIIWLFQDGDHDEDATLLVKGASLLHQFSSEAPMWLFSTSTVNTLCKEIENKINNKKVEGSSVHIHNELQGVSVDRLKELKEFLLYKINKVKTYMASNMNTVVPKKWQLYKSYVYQSADLIKKKIDSEIVEYMEAYKEFESVSLPDNVELMSRMKVIGMTTTCAARMRRSLEMLQCPIVVIEEAAEVLEAHVVSAVTKHCKHLILIGDHQQLQPSVSDYEIETQYKLGVSLFERMVMNGVECHTLDVQHRMRPEISMLIVPAIYPNLEDHESVTKYPNIRGIDGNVFFLDHNKLEECALETSKKNVHESKFLIKLAEYLIMNGYEPKEITILAGYLGQVKTLNKHQQQSSCHKTKMVAIKSIDDYQGEENKIILLSLVRNNIKRKIGFLSNKRRVCVALSRAREGLYVMGNMEHLSSRSKLWRKINERLKSHNAVGPKLRLKCQIHGHITYVDSPKNFDMIKDGGCKDICMVQLECGHECRRNCHGLDTSHVESFSCQKKCGRRKSHAIQTNVQPAVQYSQLQTPSPVPTPQTVRSTSPVGVNMVQPGLRYDQWDTSHTVRSMPPVRYIQTPFRSRVATPQVVRYTRSEQEGRYNVDRTNEPLPTTAKKNWKICSIL